MNIQHVNSIADAVAYIDNCLRSESKSRQQKAYAIVALGALDRFYDWNRGDPLLNEVFELAANAELDANNADLYWSDLVDSAGQLIAREAKKKAT